MTEFLLALALLGQSHPCDTTAGTQMLLSNVPFSIVACHPSADVVAGYEATFDADPFVWTPTAKDLGVSSVSSQRAWQASFTFGLAPGTHSVTLKAWNFKPDAAGKPTVEKQYSPVVKVAFTTVKELPPPQAGQTITVTPTAAIQGQALAVQWTCTSNCALRDWLGMFPKGATGNGGDIQWPGSYTNGAASGSYSNFKAPNAIGAYEIRYCKHTTANPSGYDCAVVAPFTVSASTAPVNCVVSAFGPWSAWAPISATQEQRTRTRTVVTPAANGGTPCPPLSETETRPIQPPPPVTKLECTYALTFTVTTENNVATVSVPVISGGCK